MFKVDPTKRAWKLRDAEATRPARPSDVINVFTENNDNPNGTLVYSGADRRKLLGTYPALEKFIDEQTGHIALPGAQCGIDDEALWNVIGATLRSSGDADLPLTVLETPKAYIKTHVILTLLEKHNLAHKLQDRLWGLLQQTMPTIETITWTWNLFGTHPAIRDRPYNPPFSDFYIQTMAWQLLNYSREGTLPATITDYIVSDSSKLQDGLKEAIEKRHAKYGFDMGYEQPQTTSEEPSPNLFANLTLSEKFKDDVKPQEHFYHAKNYMEKNLWQGRDLKAPEVPITPANTSPQFSLSKANTGITATSFLKSNTPEANVTGDDELSDEETRLAALASPLASKSAVNPFSRFRGGGVPVSKIDPIIMAPARQAQRTITANVNSGVQTSAQQTPFMSAQPQPQQPSQVPSQQVPDKPFAIGDFLKQIREKTEKVSSQPFLASRTSAGWGFGNINQAQQDASPMKEDTVNQPQQDASPMQEDTVSTANPRPTAPSLASVGWGFGNSNQTQRNTVQTQATPSQDPVGFGFGGDVRKARLNYFQPANQTQKPFGPGQGGQGLQQPQNLNAASFFGGSNNTAAASPMFGSKNLNQGAVSTFGAGVSQQNTGNMFGSPKAQQTTNPFGISNTQQNTPSAFGAATAQQNPTNAFGTSTPQQSAPSLFGQAPHQGNTNSPGMFGQAQQGNNNAPQIFGSTNTFGQTPQQSANNAPSMFGSSNTGNTPFGAPAANLVFGGNANPNTSFGASNQASQPGAPAQTPSGFDFTKPAFGGSKNSNGAFQFGAGGSFGANVSGTAASPQVSFQAGGGKPNGAPTPARRILAKPKGRLGRR